MTPSDFEYNDPIPVVTQIVCALLNGDEYKQTKNMIKTRTTGMKSSQHNSKEEIAEAREARERAELDLDWAIINKAYLLTDWIFAMKKSKGL